jgi:hypothetical protein
VVGVGDEGVVGVEYEPLFVVVTFLGEDVNMLLTVFTDGTSGSIILFSQILLELSCLKIGANVQYTLSDVF